VSRNWRASQRQLGVCTSFAMTVLVKHGTHVPLFVAVRGNKKGRAPSSSSVFRRVSSLNDAMPWSTTEAGLPQRSSEVSVVMAKMGCSPSGPKLSQHCSESDVRCRLASACPWE